jgi:hypothetical protein
MLNECLPVDRKYREVESSSQKAKLDYGKKPEYFVVCCREK